MRDGVQERAAELFRFREQSGLLRGRAEFNAVKNQRGVPRQEIRCDCDSDVVLLKIEQVGGIACHTGRRSCFFNKLETNRWQDVEPVLKDPKEIYK